MAGKNGMRVQWFTSNSDSKSVVNYGLASVSEMSAEGSSLTYLEDYGDHHTVLLENLKRNTKYVYTVGDGASSVSEQLSFTTLPEDDDKGDIRLAIFGDMGYMDSDARPMGVLGNKTMAGNWSATYSREILESWKDNGEIDMVFHVGDVGYADDAVFHTLKTLFQFEYEPAYNGYMNWIQNLTAAMPYHVTPGNHESECHDPACVLQPRKLGIPLSNFTAYNARWSMPSPESDGVASMWYSWEYGAVHFVSINTETDFDGAAENEKGDSGIFNAGKFAPDGTYLTWLENDLLKASQDPNVKWILAGGHRPFDADSSTFADVEALFTKYGVAMYFAGHSHSYSRYLPAAHEDVTTHITVGGAGCDEMLFAEDNPAPGHHTGTTCEAWSELRFPPLGLRKNRLSACSGAEFFTDAYAVGKLTIADGGRGDITWELFSSIDRTVLDSVVIKA
eukprot:CAMPEP_0181309894 /NCGR_PEP_ID=MMETSP1101-20121128/12269_1 /TAXON_ID=46948 /ORGANISM="Rhodomonas abbreviata, Strain Caron Lab Isolate" /LENGTH=448 /DNA_ID=CAMNT_0023416433 /DNA_START=92 /DNA_END=1438 /DNA_ORIENTATION=+